MSEVACAWWLQERMTRAVLLGVYWRSALCASSHTVRARVPVSLMSGGCPADEGPPITLAPIPASGQPRRRCCVHVSGLYNQAQHRCSTCSLFVWEGACLHPDHSCLPAYNSHRRPSD